MSATRRGFGAQVWRAVRRTVSIFFEIDGEQRAASFAFYAFFSLFPLLLLIVSVGSQFVEPAAVEAVITRYLTMFIPLQEADRAGVFETVRGVFAAPRGLGLAAIIGLGWAATNFFHALVRGVNRAWHTRELDWWKVPIKNLFMLMLVGIGLIFGIVVPALLGAVERFVRETPFYFPWILDLLRLLLPGLLVFYMLTMLYMVSPRRRTVFREVWLPALLATFALKGLQQLLLIYAYRFWHVNAIYGAVGVLVLLLLWVYLCGVVIIGGGCLCAAIAPEDEAERRG
jgi:YihY family inner membrane protein